MSVVLIKGESNSLTAPVRDSYLALGHTDMIGQLDSVTGFLQKWSYPNQDSTMEPEWGTVANIRYLLSSVGSVASNSSALGADVYNLFHCGREGYTSIEQDGYSASFIYRPPIFDGALALNANVGWKMAEVPQIDNDAWVINLRTTLA